jgi:hypothetical protein
LPRCGVAELLCAAIFLNVNISAISAEAFRPPSVPLVACDQYFSLWSPANKLIDADTTRWAGKVRRMAGLVKIDGNIFRIMGTEPANVPALTQTKLEVLPTRTIHIPIDNQAKALKRRAMI